MSRVKLSACVLGALFFLFVLDTAYQAFNTLRRLDVVEAERDRWQRPDEVIAALRVKPGDTVVDLGCGSGYFALKLASAVGSSGRVYAVEIRRLPLTFLWMRTLTKDRSNITTVLGQSEDPRIPSGVANAVLIANTYHEIEDPRIILTRVFHSLRPNGRLVIAEPMHTEGGTLLPDVVENHLHLAGFKIISRHNQFLEQPDRGPWWLIVVSKP